MANLEEQHYRPDVSQVEEAGRDDTRKNQKGTKTQKLGHAKKAPQATGGANEGTHKDRTGTKTGKVRRVDIPGTLI